MKKILLLFCLSFILVGCFYNNNSNTGVVEPPQYSAYEPIILQRSVFENAVKIEANKTMTESSKIYVIGDFIFINDKNKGFHIFDNKNPENPVKKKFLNVPGATDIAIRNNTLFINQATDLLSLTFNASNYTVLVNKRIKNVFPQMVSPDGYRHNLKEDEVIIGWKLK